MSEKDYAASVFIGRFQPFHKSHLEIAQHGLKIAKNLVIVIGSCNAAPNIKNPFTYHERELMIRSCFTAQENYRIHVTYVRDYFNNDNHWLADVQQKVANVINDGDSVALLGNFKDSSSYYLKMFPHWEFAAVRTVNNLNATDVRSALFSTIDNGESGWADNRVEWTHLVPASVALWIKENFLNSAKHVQLCSEFKMIKSYKDSWSVAPFPPTFVTTDAVVVQSGHVLLVRRKFEPGKGLLALPGGFLKQTEKIEDCALRELREETGIRVNANVLRSLIKESKVFDYPDRSLRGRTITHAYYIKLPDGELPEVKGNDDADKAFWLPLMDVGKREDEFFDDHYHIISWFIGR